MVEQQVILHLSLVNGVGAITLRRLLVILRENNRPLQTLYDYSVEEWGNLGVVRSLAQKIVDGLRDVTAFEKELLLLQRHNLSYVTMMDETYPELLKNIENPPPVLYYAGAPLSQHKKFLSIIGSRKGTRYAQEFITDIVMPMRNNGWSIVSGGAIGVDTMAHRAALSCGAKTVVVLGSGLLVPYPASNKKLFEQIVKKGGSVVSAFPLLTEPNKGTFPARNRIIAGLSRGTLVVQAGERSGTHITATCALEEGREVFALPGAYDDPLSRGCHALIQEGAKLVTSAEEILSEFGESCDTDEIHNKIIPTTLREKLLSLCREPQSLDDLLTVLSCDQAEMQDILFTLQVEGRIEQNFMGLFRAQ